jgi:penicillin-insensitive murein endopeptidase
MIYINRCVSLFYFSVNFISMKKIFLGLLSLGLWQIASAENPSSTCFGTTQQGHLENAWQLPSSGKNFEAYSSLGPMLGRNYVHSKVHSVAVSAYKTLESSAPDKIFVYGESGAKNGGSFKPHKTHQNGLSIDFFVPVVNSDGVSVKLPISSLNKFGYDIEFDENARYKNLAIDFEAMAKHLLAIKQAADQHGIQIGVVIFENQFQKQLFATNSGKQLPALMRFSVLKPWVRHDEHYHIDFVLKCELQG